MVKYAILEATPVVCEIPGNPIILFARTASFLGVDVCINLRTISLAFKFVCAPCWQLRVILFPICVGLP